MYKFRISIFLMALVWVLTNCQAALAVGAAPPPGAMFMNFNLMAAPAGPEEPIDRETPRPSPSPSPSPTTSPDPVLTPAPSPTPSPDETSPPEAAIKSDVVVSGIGEIPFTEVLKSIGERHEDFDTINIVQRGDTAYTVWYSDVYLCEGGEFTRILENADPDWMYVDEAGNLWFRMQGEISIVSGAVRRWAYLYKYDRGKNTFTLMKKESLHCSILTPAYKTWLLTVENGALTAYDTRDGTVTALDLVYPNADVAIVESEDAIYYQNRSGLRTLLSDLGEGEQRKMELNLGDFIDYVFDWSKYVVDSDLKLYEFRRTGYREICGLGFVPCNYVPDDGVYFVVTGDGLAFPAAGSTYMDLFDPTTRTWSSIGSEDVPIDSFECAGDGAYWFSNWQPAMIGRLDGESYVQYDLSGALFGCNWIDMAGGCIFLSEAEFGDYFEYVFLPEFQTLCRVVYPGMDE